MKFKSSYDKEVYFEKWQTPMTNRGNIWLNHQFLTNRYIYFFFRLYPDPLKKIYVMKILRYSPLRITEECNAVGFISKYFRISKKRSNSADSNIKETLSRTWKIWNTQYIKEIDSNYALSGFTKKRNKKIFQYLIVTQEEWLEFISLHEPEWKVYKNKTLAELVMRYTKISVA
jgi:hypothetical protein